MRFPVSFSQRRLWFLDQLTPGEPTYNMPYAIWLYGPLDRPALQRALDALVARQAVLRTSFIAVDGVPEQVVAGTGAVPIEHIELPAALDGGESTRQAESIAARRARRPFDLAAGPLIRAALIGSGSGRHLFVLVMHHIISDGLSMPILADELSAAYRAETTGVPAALPPLWMEYGDYAVWLHDVMRGEELDRQLGYWRRKLRGVPFLALPTDRPRPARQSSGGAVARVTIDAELTQRLAALAHGANATLFMLFLTGFVAVLSRYTRQDDVVVGTQMTGRTHAEMEPLVGLFTNTVPLRVSLADDPTFAGLLGRVRDTTLDALPHQGAPFEKLVEEFAPERTLAYSPLVQVQFVYGSLTPPSLDLPGLTSRSQTLLTGTAKLDLTMYVDSPDGQATSLVLEYSTDLFGPAWADQFLHCLARMLGHAAGAPGTAVADLPMLSAAQRDALIVGRNRPRGAVGDDDCADIRRVLRASPSQVIAGGESVPASQVCDRAARVARALAERGVGVETRVGLCVGRGIGMLTALLGVWWAGGAYVPLDPAFPRARLAAMADGAGLQVIICDSAHRDLARSIADGAAVIGVDDPAQAAPPLAPVPVPGTAPAYVIFTSGSTGRPKGVTVEHRAVTNLLASFRRTLGLGRDDRLVAVTTLSFDIALLELILPLACGADLVIATADEAREPDRLRSLIERTAATAMQATPQTWRLLESAGGVPAGLLLRLCGGDALPADLAGELMGPGVTLWNLYGPTETTVWSAAGVVTSAAGAAMIGPPIDHTRVYILDERLMPVPAGVAGEVCLAGRGVARGYDQRPGLTARSFRPDPWSDEPGARMYRTGDLGRWREGGGLELIGRSDHQVKIRGFRIECGEIEAALRAHPDVRQAAVVTASKAAQPVLVAYIVPRRGSTAARRGTDLLALLRSHLRAVLPDYMIPALVVALPSLPLTPNAKVDRAALPAPQWDALPPAAGLVLPRNPVEATLAQIWTDLLAVQSPIGVHDNLFALGGHSLTATSLVARVADAYGVSLPVHRVFTDPTIAELAEALSADPDFGFAAGSSSQAGSSSHADLDALSDEDLEDLLRAALAQRERRRAIADGTNHKPPGSLHASLD
jgi:amino acid adenylation domain-containing protein